VVAGYSRFNLLCPDEFGYVQIDPHGAELLFHIIIEREERTCIALARIVAESMDFAVRLELVCADAGVALVPQLTVAALRPEVMLARPRQKTERQIVAARRTTMRADPGLDTFVRAFRRAADARLRGKRPSPRTGGACGSYQAVAPPSTG
jgi:DNA-binding transcriptional LysR family regulator